MCLYMDSDCYCVIKEDTCDTTSNKCQLIKNKNKVITENWIKGIDSFIKNNADVLKGLRID